MRILALDTSSRPGSCQHAGKTPRGPRCGPSRLRHRRRSSCRARSSRCSLSADARCRTSTSSRWSRARGRSPAFALGSRCACKALALTSGKRIVAIPTTRGDALSSDRDVHIPPKVKPLFVVCMDGGRGDVFYAASYERTLSPVEWAVQPAVGEPDELIAAVDAIRHGRTVLAAGDGAVRERAHFESRGYLVRAPLPAGVGDRCGIPGCGACLDGRATARHRADLRAPPGRRARARSGRPFDPFNDDGRGRDYDAAG